MDIETKFREKSPGLYKGWFVIQVTPGKEDLVGDCLKKLSGSPLTLIVFKRELMHTIRKKLVKVREPLFPGYIFIHRNVNEVIAIKNTQLIEFFIHPVSFAGKLAEVCEDEMELLINNSDRNGLFLLSLGIKNGETVEFVHGSLKNILGSIVWVDKKKKKAKVELTLFRRKILVSLGFDVLETQDSLN
jgi:transcriptional antiterminator NusG